MLAVIHPNWTGSPQHFVAGVILTVVIALGLRRVVTRRAWQVAAAADRSHATAYYDSVADIADTLIGAALGAALAAIALARPTE